MCSMIEGNCSNTIEKMLMINVMGMVRINRTFIDMVMEGNGRVVNCSSECGYLTAQPFNGPYAITKYAVEAYTDSLRRELMFIGVPVVKIQPAPSRQICINLLLQVLITLSIYKILRKST